jgi:hypothetical protein
MLKSEKYFKSHVDVSRLGMKFKRLGPCNWSSRLFSARIPCPPIGDFSEMTLKDYIEECAAMLDGAPNSSGPLADLFTSIRLHKLYILALDGSEAEQQECLNYWWSLPVRDCLKRELVSQMKDARQ